MSLPKQLLQSFDEIKTSLLVSGVITNESIRVFIDSLNRSIPSPLNPTSYSIYRFNRSKYIADKERFVKDIKNFVPYEALILWTDFQDILSAFDLNGKIFLGWDKNTNRYRGYALKNPNEPSTSNDLSPKLGLPPMHPNSSVQILRRGETVNSAKAEAKEQTNTFISPEEMDDDMERVYDYMQNRMAKLSQQLAQL